jgi:hypothetical protein
MLDKLDAYNIVANLVPGAALVYALHYSGFPTPNPERIGAFLLVAFVAGVTTNRIGSLVLDPLLRWNKIGFLFEKDYPAFVGSEREDEKLETLVANSGLYRTFFTAGLIYLMLLAIDLCLTKIDASAREIFIGFVVVGMIVFLFALRKEDGYIKSRIDKVNQRSEDS